ncbi:MAG: tRNA pseudouridine(55) synthase TruB [Acidobacteria bacterium]|nr:tRNA pseudouridine(55) synthase TruB [Acidobacteriota bacterium]MCA1641644.1 tRNA pseudouridine(55) synthase TruB [Acidobacteriota bacterium]
MDGLLIIDKPAGWTSHDVVARARRCLRERRVGHTGTLDPFATGLLVLLVGRATRLAQFLAGAEKEYEATVRLGYATETGDLTGARRGEVSACGAWGAAEIEGALRPLRGGIDQVPPMYSAKKVQGRKLYELARRGEEIEREAVRVNVSAFEIAPDETGAWLRRNEDGTCDLSTRVVCSAGTYVRVLAESVGERLGTGAHLSALRRTRAGAFRVGHSVSLDRLNELAEAGRASEILIGMNAALPELPAAHLTNDEARRVRHGAAVVARARSDGWADGASVRMLDAEGRLLAVGIYDAARGHVQPRVMLAGDEGGGK